MVDQKYTGALKLCVCAAKAHLSYFIENKDETFPNSFMIR